jgi:putative SOS response-associated peptidase YedK
MCGRYTLHLDKKKLREALELEIPEDYEPDYNIGPGRKILGITRNSEKITGASMLNWGLKTPHNFHINARLETAHSTPRFRDSWFDNRCLIPANGFYEWYQDGVSKVPYYIYPEDQGLIYFAGLCFPSERTDEAISCVILTTNAIPSVRKIHERMPAIIPTSHHADWLNTSLNKSEVRELSERSALTPHSVSRRVNSVQNKDSRLIEATSPLADDQMMLF